jgi:multidrug efflux pump subunit AcrA (membrane-fusion protein)
MNRAVCWIGIPLFAAGLYTSFELLADTVGDLTMPKQKSERTEAKPTGVSTPPLTTPSPPSKKPTVGANPTSTPVIARIDPAIDTRPLDESKAIAVQESVVRFAEELNVPSTEAGLIAELSVAAGDSIQWGDPIARLDDRALRIRSHAASLRLESAMQQAADDLELQYAETALKEAEAELEASRSIYNDAAGAVPLSTIRRLRLSVERAQLEVARAKKAANLAKIEIDLRSADVSVLDETMKRLQLQSPLAGVVLQVFRQRGEWVAAGEPVVRVARIDRLDVHGLLSADDLSPQACRDQSVSVRWVDATTKAEHRLRGRVTAVQPQRLAGGRYRFQASVANEKTSDGKDWQLHPGTEVRMFVYSPASVR